MTKREMTETILNAKDAKGVSWAEIAKAGHGSGGGDSSG